MKRFFTAAIFCLFLLLLTLQESPAPIVEQEKPTPVPEQLPKPKSKQASNSRTSETSKRRTGLQQLSPALVNAAESDGKSFMIRQSQMTASATSQHPGNEARNAVDGNGKTIWHTPWGLFGPETSLPQSIILNLGGAYSVHSLRYLPRQDSGIGSLNGNILSYRIYASMDGTNFAQVAAGNWSDDHTEKNVTFGPTRASYLRLEAVTAHGGHASAAELNVAATR